jgi:hypothetical protein
MSHRTPHTIPSVCRLFALLVGLSPGFAGLARGADIDRDPINYGTAPLADPVARLQQRIEAGETRLSFDDRFGYLPAVLRELNVSPASQTLVFSKTSFQRQFIDPRMPRALYFGDRNYVGYCQEGAVLEFLSVDPNLGSVFYTLDQEKADKPRFERQTESCLICHASSQNDGLPGQVLRSLFVGPDGQPLLSMGGRYVDQTTPLAERWGGWYVTGTTGKQNHLGNLVVRGKHEPEQIDNTAGRNVTDLGRFLDTAGYLTPHSDVVALMVLEHQAAMQNRITRANYLTRIALYDEAEMSKALGQPNAPRSDLTTRRITSACEPLVQYMLFSGEAPLTDRVQGASDFAKEFAAQGPRDGTGRSLRDFDLTTRLFAYPCSYLIYSESFEALPGAAKDYVLHRLWDVLSGKDQSKPFAHLSASDRRAILEILRATKKNLPAYWTNPEGK